MGTRLLDIAQLIGGHVVGDLEIEITGAATIRDVQPGEITLADNPKHFVAASESLAAAVLVGQNLAVVGKPCIQVLDVHAAFAQIVAYFRPPRRSTKCGVSPAAAVSPSAKIAPDAVIYPQAFIGEDVEIGAGTIVHSGCRILDGCRIGMSCTLFPNAVLYENTVVGDRVIIHANSVIGAYGFGYQCVQGRYQLSAQLGNVEIEDDVEIGAGTTVDRGTYGSTKISEGTKIDNQVMIAHNCRIGRHNLLCSQVGIAGSCTTGDYVVMAGQVGIKDHINVGERSVLGAKAGVMRDIPPNSTFLGIPATPEREQMHILASIAKLPELRRQLRVLEQQVDKLVRPATPRSDAA